MKPGYTYPPHNHPAPELYFVVDGQADWYVDDEGERVTPGSLVYDRPFYRCANWATSPTTNAIAKIDAGSATRIETD